MADFPLNVPTDDALSLLDAEGPHPATLHDPSDSSDDNDDTEDPVSRGQSKAAKKDMFVPHNPGSHIRPTRGGNGVPGAGGFLRTPGFHRIP